MFGSLTISKYAGVALLLVAAGFGLPVPEEIPIVTAGAMVGHDAQELIHDDIAGALGGGPLAYLTPQPTNVTKWWIMLPVIIIAVVVGDSVLYCVGRFGGTRLLANGWVQRRILPPDRQASIVENFHKNGIMILLGARLTPGLRSPVFLMAGVLRMSVRRFLLADLLYAIPGVNILFWLSYVFTDQFVEAIKSVERHKPLVFAVILAAIIGAALYKIISSRKVSTGDMSQIPGYAKPVAGVTNAIEKAVEKTVEKTIEKTAQVIDKVTHPHRHDADPVAGPPIPPAPGA